MTSDVSSLKLSSDELRVVERYAWLSDHFSRLALTLQAGDGDWHYAMECVENLQREAGRMLDTLTEERTEDGETYRALRPAFAPPVAEPDGPFDIGEPLPDGQARSVPAGYADPGKIRAGIAGVCWPYAVGRALHPAESIEDA